MSLAKTPVPATTPGTHHIHIPGLGYWVLLVLGLIAGFILGRVWDEVVDWLFDTTSILRHWFETLCGIVGVVALIYVLMHYVFHLM